MAKTTTFNRPEITTITEGDYEGAPTLALPTGNPRFPIQMTVKKWRIVLANVAAITAFCEKHKAWQPAEQPKKGKPVTSKEGTVDLSKLDPATKALVEAAIAGSKPAAAPAPAAPAVPAQSLEDRLAALRAQIAK
jgi:hypothetical protein